MSDTVFDITIIGGGPVGLAAAYYAGHREASVCIVESLEQPSLIAGLTHCVRLTLRVAPSPAPPQIRAWCVQDWKLVAYDDSTLDFQPLRPVGPGMTLELPRPDGSRIVYETGRLERDTVGTAVLEVVPTTVTTLDAWGRAIRRLRERYAVAIASATRGTFELPDSVAPYGLPAGSPLGIVNPLLELTPTHLYVKGSLGVF